MSKDEYAKQISPLVIPVANELEAIGMNLEAEQLLQRQAYGYCIISAYNRAINLIVSHYIQSKVIALTVALKNKLSIRPILLF